MTTCNDPKCTCGCREGKPCTCETKKDAGSREGKEHTCMCGPDCTCGCQQGMECTCGRSCGCE
ncbi:MAG: hypothetical protein ACI4PW_00415 [Alphaproteobacteria bacterium]